MDTGGDSLLIGDSHGLVEKYKSDAVLTEPSAGKD